MDTLRRLGFSVQSLSRVGGGVPDLLVARGGQTYLVEAKTPGTYYGNAVNARQARWAATWNAPVVVLRTVEEATAWGIARQAERG